MKPETKLSAAAGLKIGKTSVALEARSAGKRVDPDDLDDMDLGELSDDFVLAPAPPCAEARPNPVELPAPINPEGGSKQSVELHRNLFCLHYDDCLDEAVRRSWNSFSCVRCALYQMNRNEEEAGVRRFATQRRAS